MDISGIYCFLSKDKSAYYIGSSINMKARYNRHVHNVNSSNERNYMASPKFYNFVRKYGLDFLDFGCLLATNNYLYLFRGF